MTLKKFYKADELAKILQVSRRTIIRLIDDGELKASKVGAQWRISQEQVERYLSCNDGEEINSKTDGPLK